jgi:hypothetical protein
MDALTITSAVLGFLGLIFFALAVSRLRRRKIAAAGLHGTAGGCAWLLGVALVAIAFNLHSYRRLTYEQMVAEIVFRQFEPNAYGATLSPAGGEETRRFVIRGDEWQIDARVLKWRGVANLLGLDSHYRLERLSGRYASLSNESNGARTVYGLVPKHGLDLWGIANRYQRWVPMVDAIYGSAAFLPMANGARYEIRVTQSGLIARPINVAAERAVAAWR